LKKKSTETTFTLNQLLKSKRFPGVQRDLKGALFLQGEQYTIEAVTKAMEQYLKQEAK